jgi:hypothetical protein
MPSVPGVQVTHQTITDDCRVSRGEDGVVDETLRRIEKSLRTALGYWAPGSGAKFHVAVTFERPSASEPAPA